MDPLTMNLFDGKRLKRYELSPIPKPPPRPRPRVDQAFINQAILYEEECKKEIDLAESEMSEMLANMKKMKKKWHCAAFEVSRLKGIQDTAAKFLEFLDGDVDDGEHRTMKEWQALDEEYFICSGDGFRDVNIEDYRMGLLEYIERRLSCTLMGKKK